MPRVSARQSLHGYDKGLVPGGDSLNFSPEDYCIRLYEGNRDVAILHED